MVLFIDNGYNILKKSYCEPEHGRFTTLSEAKQRCSNDPSCAMVYHYHSHKGDFRLCDKGFKIKASSHDSTLYVKITGMYHCYLCFSFTPIRY